MRRSRGVGTWGPDTPPPHGKAKSNKFPQEYWFGTNLPMSGHQRTASDAPVLATGYRFHRNTGTDPLPLLKKKMNKRQTSGC